MTKEFFEKFKNAIDTAGINDYEAVIDTGTNMFNTNTAVIAYDADTESLINIRGKITNSIEGWGDDYIVTGAGLEDVHYVRFGAPLDMINSFIEAFAAELTEDQKNILLKINKGNYNINPENGDYLLAGFKVLEDEEIQKLSSQEKIDYEKKLEIYKERKKMGKNQNIQVTLG